MLQQDAGPSTAGEVIQHGLRKRACDCEAEELWLLNHVDRAEDLMGEAYMYGLAAREIQADIVANAVTLQQLSSELLMLEGPTDPGIEGSIGQKILTAQMESLQIQREVIEMQNLADESYIKMINIIDEN